MIKSLRIATRQSPLALVQSEWVKAQLQHHYPALQVELVSQLTEGDRNTAVALNQVGGKNLFVKELQTTLLDGRADIAVHSVKDLSCAAHPVLSLAAIGEREDPRDVWISQNGSLFTDLPAGSVVGTASPRRECQLKQQRPDLSYRLLRGNVETRLAKLAAGEYDAIVLAAAGLKRLNKIDHVTAYFSTSELLPAIGQGAIGIECRTDALALRELLQVLNHAPTAACVRAERAVNARLGGDCFTPIAAFATLADSTLQLRAWVGSLTTTDMIAVMREGPVNEPESLGLAVAEDLLQAGAGRLLQHP